MLKYASFALAAAAIAAAPAAARPSSDAYIVFVPYADLNLTSNEGSKALERRVKATANRICGPRLPGSLADAHRADTCRAQVLNAARAQVDRAISQRS